MKEHKFTARPWEYIPFCECDRCQVVAFLTKPQSNADFYAKYRKPMTERKYLPTLSDLIDRLSIVQLKAIFNPAKRKEYREEIALIENDIDFIGVNGFSAAELRAAMVIMLVNREIWRNEAAVRDGTGEGDLRLTHSLNGVRNTAKNRIAAAMGERLDYKVDCLAAELEGDLVNWRVFE